MIYVDWTLYNVIVFSSCTRLLFSCNVYYFCQFKLVIQSSTNAFQNFTYHVLIQDITPHHSFWNMKCGWLGDVGVKSSYCKPGRSVEKVRCICSCFIVSTDHHCLLTWQNSADVCSFQYFLSLIFKLFLPMNRFHSVSKSAWFARQPFITLRQ